MTRRKYPYLGVNPRSESRVVFTGPAQGVVVQEPASFATEPDDDDYEDAFELGYFYDDIVEDNFIKIGGPA